MGANMMGISSFRVLGGRVFIFHLPLLFSNSILSGRLPS